MECNIQLPEKVKLIINTLMSAGYEAYAVGGCVRDCILGRIPSDWDITTSALPMEVKALFSRTIDTGIQHGTVTVMFGKEGFEVTTYRIDGTYEDSRHPKEVQFTPSLMEDLKRRDFTINAMAYNDVNGLVDKFFGMADIQGKIIRCVGEPEERFSEDALRIMRAVRFSAQLGYRIEETTQKAMEKLAPALSKISAERIQAELVKLVTSNHPDWLRNAYEAGITKVILPELDDMMETEQNNPHHCYTVGEHALHAMEYVEADKMLRLGMLFHDVGKPFVQTKDEQGIHHFYRHSTVGEKLAGKALRRLKFDNETIRTVQSIAAFHDYKIEPTNRGIRRAMAKMGETIFPMILKVKKADVLAQSNYQRKEKLEELVRLQTLYEEELAAQNCVCLKDLAVTGKDLIACGMKPGKELGKTLEKLLALVIDNPECNTKEYLLQKVKCEKK